MTRGRAACPGPGYAQAAGEPATSHRTPRELKPRLLRIEPMGREGADAAPCGGVGVGGVEGGRQPLSAGQDPPLHQGHVPVPCRRRRAAPRRHHVHSRRRFLLFPRGRGCARGVRCRGGAVLRGAARTRLALAEDLSLLLLNLLGRVGGPVGLHVPDFVLLQPKNNAAIPPQLCRGAGAQVLCVVGGEVDEQRLVAAPSERPRLLRTQPGAVPEVLQLFGLVLEVMALVEHHGQRLESERDVAEVEGEQVVPGCVEPPGAGVGLRIGLELRQGESSADALNVLGEER